MMSVIVTFFKAAGMTVSGGDSRRPCIPGSTFCNRGSRTEVPTELQFYTSVTLSTKMPTAWFRSSDGSKL